MPHNAEAQPNGEFRAVINRADGRTTDLGVIAATYRNPVKQWWWQHWGRPRAHRRIARANREAHLKEE